MVGASLKRHVLLDIDGTITDDRADSQIADAHLLGNALFEVLKNLAIEQGQAPADVEEKMKAYERERVYWDYPDFIPLLGLPADEVWARWEAWHREHIVVYPDAVRFATSLNTTAHHLHIVSNNPHAGCLMKLAAAGLGTRTGSELVEHMFCSNSHRGQKHDPDFWARALHGTAMNPGDVTVIGDDPHEDYEVPRQVGIRSFFLLNRSSQRAEAIPDGYRVPDLDSVMRAVPDAFSPLAARL